VVRLPEVDTAWLLARKYLSSLVDFMIVQSMCMRLFDGGSYSIFGRLRMAYDSD